MTDLIDAELNLQRCPTCKQRLPESSFQPSAWGRPGRPCRECHKARQRTQPKPDRTAYRLSYRQTPKGKARRSAYDNSPEGKAVRVAYRQSAQGKARSFVYRNKPESKVRAAAYSASYLHRKKYGMTIEEKEVMLAAQDGRCRCCGRILDSATQTARPCTDHTLDPHGKVIIRGILCGNCNLGIGSLGDDLEGVLNAVRYLTGAR